MPGRSIQTTFPPPVPAAIRTRSAKPKSGGWRHRLAVASRVCAALFGGYFFAHASTAFLTLVMPFARAERVITASLLSFPVWCAIAVYVFSARSAWRAWWAPVLAGAVLLGIQMQFPEMAARP